MKNSPEEMMKNGSRNYERKQQQLNPHQLVEKGSDIFIYVCLEVHIYINFRLNCKQRLILRDLESIA